MADFFRFGLFFVDRFDGVRDTVERLPLIIEMADEWGSSPMIDVCLFTVVDVADNE